MDRGVFRMINPTRNAMPSLKSSTRIAIPLMTGVKGNILDFPFTKDGNTRFTKIHWITPLEIQFPDGWNIFKLTVVPTLQSYEGKFHFEIWDTYQLSKPKYLGRVNIDADTNDYSVELEQRYHCYRLSMLFIIHHAPQVPFYTMALENGTPYGEWRYKDVI